MGSTELICPQRGATFQDTLKYPRHEVGAIIMDADVRLAVDLFGWYKMDQKWDISEWADDPPDDLAEMRPAIEGEISILLKTRPKYAKHLRDVQLRYPRNASQLTTFKECGNRSGTTRERVRQRVQKGLWVLRYRTNLQEAYNSVVLQAWLKHYCQFQAPTAPCVNLMTGREIFLPASQYPRHEVG